jgi:hypothetical protein
MKSRKQIVENLASLPDWNSLSKRMTWMMRKNEEGVPELLTLVTGIKQITRAEWVALRKEVIAYKRHQKYMVKKRKETARADARRQYMRSYMRRYRQEQNA